LAAFHFKNKKGRNDIMKKRKMLRPPTSFRLQEEKQKFVVLLDFEEVE
jgi:hypothetical protein